MPAIIFICYTRKTIRYKISSINLMEMKQGMKETSLWNTDFLLDTGINFVVYLIYYLLMVIIAVVAKDQLNASLSEAGLASGVLLLGHC